MARCDLCGFEGVFLDFKGRSGVKCPSCSSLERQRALVDVIKCNVSQAEEPGESCLHVAPSCKTQFSNLLAKYGYGYTAIDIAGRRGDQASIEDLDYEDDKFSLILCLHVLEHVDDDRKALKELARVLDCEGLLILQVPVGGVEGRDGHKRIYSKDGLEELIGEHFVWAITQRDKEVFYLCSKIVSNGP